MDSPTAAKQLERSRTMEYELRRRTCKPQRQRNLLSIMDKLLVDILDGDTKVADRSSLAKAFCVCEDSLRVLRGESKPANLSISQSMQLSKARRPQRIVDVESVVRSLQATQATEGPTLPE